MANTFILIASKTVPTDGTTSITFSSIPQTYTDLKFVWSAQDNRNDGNWGYLYGAFNGSTSNLSYRSLYSSGGNGSQTTYADTTNNISYGMGTIWMSGQFSNAEMYIPNYTSSSYKSWYVEEVCERATADADISMFGGVWANNAAITSLTFSTQSGRTFSNGTKFYLYGIKNS